MDFNSGYAPVTSVQNAVKVDWDHYAIDESGPVLDLQCFSANYQLHLRYFWAWSLLYPGNLLQAAMRAFFSFLQKSNLVMHSIISTKVPPRSDFHVT